MKLLPLILLGLICSVFSEDFDFSDLGEEKSLDEESAIISPDHPLLNGDTKNHYIITLDSKNKGKDNHEHCNYWSENGECESNPVFMRHICPVACGIELTDQELIVDTVPEEAAAIESEEIMPTEEYDYPEEYNLPEDSQVQERVIDYFPEQFQEGPISVDNVAPDTNSALMEEDYNMRSMEMMEPEPIEEPIEQSVPMTDVREESSEEYFFEDDDIPLFEDEDEGLCADFDDSCESWASLGECFNNPTYMRKHCKLSCGECNEPIELIEVEDPAPAPQHQYPPQQIGYPYQPQHPIQHPGFISPAYFEQTGAYPEYGVADSAPAQTAPEGTQYSAYPDAELAGGYNGESPEMTPAQLGQAAEYQFGGSQLQISPEQMAQFQAQFASQQPQQVPQLTPQQLAQFQARFSQQQPAPVQPQLSAEQLAAFQAQFASQSVHQSQNQLTPEQLEQFQQEGSHPVPKEFTDFHRQSGPSSVKFPEWDDVVGKYYAGVRTPPISPLVGFGGMGIGGLPSPLSPFGHQMFMSPYGPSNGYFLPRLAKSKRS